SGPRSNGSNATVGIQNSARNQGVQTGYHQPVLSSGAAIGYHFNNGTYTPVTAPPLRVDNRYSIVNRGGLSLITDGSETKTAVGFGIIQPDSGNSTPPGTAIFGYKPANVLVSEAGVPATPSIQSGRIYAEVGDVVNTGLAIVNPGAGVANLSYYFTD